MQTTNEIDDLTKEKAATAYQKKDDEIQKEIQKKIEAKNATKTAKETAIGKLDRLLSGYQANLTQATDAHAKEFAVMQQSDLVSQYTDAIAKAQSALDAYKSQVESYNEAITNINKENEKKEGYKKKNLITLETDQGYLSATQTVTNFTTLKTNAKDARDNARTAAAASRRADSRTLEEAIAKAEQEYSQKVYEILNPKQN